MNAVMTMERTEIALEAWRTVDEIKASPVYVEFAAAETALLGALGPQAEIARFTAAKAAYEPILRFGKHHPDFKRVATELAAAKTALYATEAHRRYAAAITALNAVLDPIAEGIKDILDGCRVGTKTHCGKR